MLALDTAQGLIVLLLSLAAFAVEVFALVDAAREREDAFRAAGKQTKQRWLVFLAIATLVGFGSISARLSFFGLIAVVVAAVYLADVRPALRQVRGRGSHSGPYGPW
jgi:cobalamin synthase